MAVLPPTAAIILSGRTAEAKSVLGDEVFENASKALSAVYSNNSGVILDVSD